MVGRDSSPGRVLPPFLTKSHLLANVACPCGSGKAFLTCHGANPVGDVELRRSIVTAMNAAAIPPEFIYAYERTGLIVTTENRSKISAADLDE